MKSTSLFQFGGISLLLYMILGIIANLIYYLSGQPEAPTTLGLWLAIFGEALLVLGLGAVFARQAPRGGILGVVGYILLVVAILYFVGSEAVGLGVASGAISAEQIAQVPAYILADSVFPWIWVAGLAIFGISLYRAQLFPKYAGVLLVLYAFVFPLTGPLAFTRPIYAILANVVWGWLGWRLLAGGRSASPEPIPATAVAGQSQN